jgi:two-component system sensor histidine kinase YesM
VVSLLPITELQRKSQFIKNINFSLLAVLIVFTFIISILFSYLITRPLKKLMKSFRKLQEGDFGTRVEVKGEDEFAKIGRTFNTMVANIKSLIEQKYEMNILRKQAELESLQSQINPHFLFNTLNSIKAVIDKKDYRHSSIMVESLSDIFRYSLNRGRHIIKFSEELEHVKKYLYIQQCRFTDRYEVYYDIDEDVLDYNILRLTLQPIVENALYHGLSPKRGKGELKIAAKTFNDKYYIYISDNGVGIPREELIQINTLLDNNPDTHNSLTPEKLGIYNVNARVKLHFGNDYGLRIYSCPGSGTTVRITLPVNILKGDECVENISC